MMLKKRKGFHFPANRLLVKGLDYLDELSDLASISAVLRGFHALTLPLLYKTISWEWNSVPLSRILRLFRTVIKNPNLASFIQHLTHLSDQKNVEQHD